MCSAVRESVAAAGLAGAGLRNSEDTDRSLRNSEDIDRSLRNSEDINRSLRIDQLSTTPYSDATQVNRGWRTVSREGFVKVGSQWGSETVSHIGSVTVSHEVCSNCHMEG